MRRILILFSLLVVTVLLAGCGGEPESGNSTMNANSSNTSTTVNTSTTNATSASPSPTAPINTNASTTNANRIPPPNSDTNANGNANTSAQNNPPEEETVRARLASLYANVAFRTPEQMQLNENATVHLALGTNQSGAELGSIVQGPGKVEITAIRISDHVEAKLIGSAFEIRSANPDEQIVTSTQPTEWVWQITPLKPGPQQLILTINAIIYKDGKEDRLSIQTLRRDLKVNVTMKDRAADFISQNWQWLWATIAVPLGGPLAVWLWRRKKKRKSTQPAKKKKQPRRPQAQGRGETKAPGDSGRQQ